MSLCDNVFAIKNVSTEDVYLQLPGIYVLHPGEWRELFGLGISLQTITNSEALFTQFARGRLVQVEVPNENNISIPTLQRTLTETGTKYTQYETEQLLRGCGFEGDLGPYDPLGGGGPGSGLTRVSALLGNGVNTKFRVTHSLETEDVLVQVYSNFPPKDTVFPLVNRLNDNQVEIQFDRPPSTDQYTVIIIG